MHKARVIIQTENREDARTIYESLIPDTEGDEGSTITMRICEQNLRIDVTAEEIPVLRACLNTLMRGCDVAIESLRVAKGCEKI